MINEPAFQIQDFVFSNYEDIRHKLQEKYAVFISMKHSHEGIFHLDITKQFVDMIHSYITSYITTRTNLNTEDVRVYVEEHFTFDNIGRIISEDGDV